MVAYPAYNAVYHNGRLELREPVNLVEGATVKVIVLEGMPMDKPGLLHVPTVPASFFRELVGVVSVGGDAVKDSEALYDDD